MLKRTAEERDRGDLPVQLSEINEQPLQNDNVSSDSEEIYQSATKIIRINDNYYDNTFNVKEECSQGNSPELYDSISPTSSIEERSSLVKTTFTVSNNEEIGNFEFIVVENNAPDFDQEEVKEQNDDSEEYFDDEEEIGEDQYVHEHPNYDEEIGDDQHVNKHLSEDEEEIGENQNVNEHLIDDSVDDQDMIVIDEEGNLIHSQKCKPDQVELNALSDYVLNEQINDSANLTSSDDVSLPSCSSNRDGSPSEIDSPDSDQQRRSLLKSPGQRSLSKKSVIFRGVTVFYFRRSQGFTCVPSVGGSTLGMDKKHVYCSEFTIESHAQERERNHRETLLQQKRLEKISKQSSTSDEDNSGETSSDLSESELGEDQLFFLQPVPIKRRRELLRASGVTKIFQSEKFECQSIRKSREQCGCECFGQCLPDRCSCALAGIKCQVDRFSFPCGCSSIGCHNDNGRVEFNQERVKAHLKYILNNVKVDSKEVAQSNQISAETYPPQYEASYSNDRADSSSIYMPIKDPSLFVANSSPHLISQSTEEENLYNQTDDSFSSNSSCSEVSDYTNGDLERYNGQVRYSNVNASAIEVPPAIAIDQCSTPAIVLPPFVSINTNIDLTSRLPNPPQQYPYQNSSSKVSMYEPYISPIPSTSSTQVFYDIQNPEYPNYSNEKEGYLTLNATGDSFIIECNQNDTTDTETSYPQQQPFVNLNLSMASSASFPAETIEIDPSTFAATEQPVKMSNNITIPAFTVSSDESSSVCSDNNSLNHSEDKTDEKKIICNDDEDELNSEDFLEVNSGVSSADYNDTTDTNIAQTACI